MSSQQEEKILIDRVLSGSQPAFVELIKKYERLVYHIIFRLVRNKEDHEDLGQDVFIKVYSHLKKFKGDSKLSTWIARIAYNTSLNFLEKKRVSLLDDLIDNSDDEDFSTSALENVSSEGDLPDLLLEKNVGAGQLQDAINLLPAKFKAVLTLYHMEEMKYKEIAEITDLPEGTVKSYLFRARKMLKDSLLKNYKMEDICL